LCRDCSGKKCRDKGTVNEPVFVECPTCGGHGCESCGETGDFSVVGCPSEFCSDTAATIELIDLFNDGLPPIAGGVLDQSAWFISAVRRMRIEDQLAKAND